MDGLEWVELFVREMSAASDVEDARIRASRALEAFEKTIRAHAKADTAQNFQQVIIFPFNKLDMLTGLLHACYILA